MVVARDNTELRIKRRAGQTPKFVPFPNSLLYFDGLNYTTERAFFLALGGGFAQRGIDQNCQSLQSLVYCLYSVREKQKEKGNQEIE